MGRIADAIFYGAVSGSARGMSNYLETSSNSEKKVQSVAKESLTNSSGECPPVKTWPDGQDRHIVGSRKPGSPNSFIPESAQMPTLVRGVDNSENSSQNLYNSKTVQTTQKELECPILKTNLDRQSEVPAGIKEQDSPVDSLPAIKDPNVIKAAEHIEKNPTIEKAPDFVGDVFNKGNSSASIPQKIYDFPRFDEVKNGIKIALMNARQKAELHGVHGHDKIHLNEICEWVKHLRQNTKEGGPRGERQLLATKLALENTVAFIKEIAPHVDAQEVAIAAFKEGGGNIFQSKICLERLAKEALREIEIRSHKEGVSLNKLENIVYIRRAPWEVSHPPTPYEWDRGNEEANPYSPLGPPGMNDRSSYESGRDIAMNDGYQSESPGYFSNEEGFSNNSNNENFNRFISETTQTAVHGGTAYGYALSENWSLALYESYQAAGHAIEAVNAGYDTLKESSPPDFAPPDPSMAECGGPVFPSFDYSRARP